MRSTRLLLEPQALLTSDHCLSYTCFQEDPFLKTPQREFKALQGNFHFQNLMGKAFSHQNSRVKEVNYSKDSKAYASYKAKDMNTQTSISSSTMKSLTFDIKEKSLSNLTEFLPCFRGKIVPLPHQKANFTMVK